MSDLKRHIAFRLATIGVVILLFLPHVVKMVHISDHHAHNHCTGETSTHIHKVDLDCDFLKFQIQKNVTFATGVFDLFSELEPQVKVILQYGFLSDYQLLQFSLRGPPQINLV